MRCLSQRPFAPERPGRLRPCPYPKPSVKLVLDLLPVIVFFGAFRLARSFPALQSGLEAVFGPLPAASGAAADLGPIIVATACAMVAIVVQIAWMKLRRMKVSGSVWLSAALITILGGLTLWLRNEWFIKWKPTILYWTFALVLSAGQWIWKRNLLGALFSSEIDLPEPAWRRLLIAWVAFFVAVGAANLLVAYRLSTDAWVNFKTFGILGLTFAFAIPTGWYVARHLKDSGGG
jgi:intracellular septation protein